MAQSLWQLYQDKDATLVEINPLCLTRQGSFVALDAKVTIDANALFRHPEFASLQGTDDERERRAREAGFAYVSLAGEIGVLGNGAGLVMSLLDGIEAAGGRAANFLDVGGGATHEQIAKALEILLSDDRVRRPARAIFGGITRCDEVARGLLSALAATDASLPVVVSLTGTNCAEGNDLLAEAGRRNLHVEASIAEAISRSGGAGRGERSFRGTDPRRVLRWRSSSMQHSKVLVQGITGREGAFHTARMLAAGTTVVAGTSPGKGGQTVAGVPVFDCVAEAVAATGATVSVIFVPARLAEDAILEAADAGLEPGGLHHRGHRRARHRRGRLRSSSGCGACCLGPTARVSSRRACPTWASCRPTSSEPGRSGWSRAAAH